MIKSKNDLKFYLKADEIMNEDVFHRSLWGRIFYPPQIKKYLHALRHLEYYNHRKKNIFIYPLFLYYHIRFDRLGYKLGFEIPPYSLGYGVRIAHHGSIVMNGSTKIGNYCCINNLVTFADGNPKNIGNRVFIGTGCVICKNVTIADGCKISACSLVNKNFLDKDILIGGVPAKKLLPCKPWTEEYQERIDRCEKLRIEMGVH